MWVSVYGFWDMIIQAGLAQCLNMSHIIYSAYGIRAFDHSCYVDCMDYFLYDPTCLKEQVYCGFYILYPYVYILQG